MLILKNNNLQLKQYQESEAPYRLPDNLNLISWSMPFLAEKITGMLYHILRNCSPAELREEMGHDLTQKVSELTRQEQEKLERKINVKNKIMAMGRMNKMLTTLRENSEMVLQMKQVSLDGRLPRGILLKNRSDVKFDKATFDFTKDLDAKDEKRPKSKSRK